MIVRSSLHNHTDMCDGISTPQEMAEAAIDAGFTDLGISGHSYAPFDIEYSIKDEAGYIAAIRALQEEYANRINIYCGTEHDYYSKCDAGAYDYRIGSVHYLRDESGEYHALDGDSVQLRRCSRSIFGGDMQALAHRYFEMMAEHVTSTRPQIIGHFDVITKCQRMEGLFDTESREYRDAALESLNACLETGAFLEINTGAIARGYTDMPYPEMMLLKAARDMGGMIILSTDCHDASKIDYGLDMAAEYARAAGFRSRAEYIDGEFEEVGLL